MILNSYNNILVLAPHTDDGELGLGGTILMHGTPQGARILNMQGIHAALVHRLK